MFRRQTISPQWTGESIWRVQSYFDLSARCERPNRSSRRMTMIGEQRQPVVALVVVVVVAYSSRCANIPTRLSVRCVVAMAAPCGCRGTPPSLTRRYPRRDDSPGSVRKRRTAIPSRTAPVAARTTRHFRYTVVP